MAEKNGAHKSQLDAQTNSLVVSLENVFKSAPHLPENIREVLVKLAPWLALIFGILGVLSGIGAVLASPLALLGGLHNSFITLVTGLLVILSSALLLLAYPKLKVNAYAGWKLLFWSELVNIISSLVRLVDTPAMAWVPSIIGLIIGAAFGLYILFEMKGYYK